MRTLLTLLVGLACFPAAAQRPEIRGVGELLGVGPERGGSISVGGFQGGRFEWVRSCTPDGVLRFAGARVRSGRAGCWSRVWDGDQLQAAWAAGTGSSDDQRALSVAITLASRAGAELVLGPYTYTARSLTLPRGLRLRGAGGTLRRLGAPVEESFIVMSSDTRIDGTLQIDGADRRASGHNRAVRIVGDRAFIGAGVSISGFTRGMSYVIDVVGDHAVVNGRVEGASYASVRLASVGPRRMQRFTLGEFTSVDAAYKGFVYNGTSGVDVIRIQSFTATTSSLEPASGGILIDSVPDNTVLHVGLLDIDRVDIWGGESNCMKVENTARMVAGVIRCRNGHSRYPHSAGLRLDAHAATVGVFDSDNRAVVNGSFILSRFIAAPGLSTYHALEFRAIYGDYVRVGTLDLARGETATLPVRIDTEGRPLDFEIDSYRPSTSRPRALQIVVGEPPDALGARAERERTAGFGPGVRCELPVGRYASPCPSPQAELRGEQSAFERP